MRPAPRAPASCLALVSLLALCSGLFGCGSSDASSQTAQDAASDAPEDASSEDASSSACEPNPCKQAHQTVCKVIDGGATCSCDTGFLEQSGTCVTEVKCQPDTCHAHGTCKIVDNLAQCACQPGWAQPVCDKCDEAGGWHSDSKGGCTNDPCVPDPCGGDPDLVCKNEAGTAKCVCRPGTHDESGDCVPDSTCSPTTCSGHGTCSESGGKLICSCDEGWTGSSCNSCDEMSGWHSDGQGGCTKDPCVPNPCSELNKTTCTASEGSAVCSCNPGFHEEAGACVADETCTSSTCGGHGSCTVSGGKVVCNCASGYEGLHCEACASGFHSDGSGGCTDDPCVPNPCTSPLQTSCVVNGTGYTCQCDAGAHPDGQGACTKDPCKPDPCAAQNLACKVVGSTAECYQPQCSDGDPCTNDSLVGGVCQHLPASDGSPCSTSACAVGQTCQGGKCNAGTPASCNDGNPCTIDSCDDTSGCINTIDASIVPGDGFACTQDSCDQAGVAHHVPVDAACEDGKYCNGTGKCSPSDPAALENGCIAVNVPQPPSAASGCKTWSACKETEPHFELVEASAGTSCNDQIACTANDVCQAGGICKGTPISGCLSTTCEATTPFTGAIDVPTSTVAVDVTLAGQPLPGGSNPSSDTMFIYLRAADTGALHQVRQLWYTTGGGPWPNPAEDTWSVLPGIYDVIYRRGYSSQAAVVYENPSGDKLPNGYRVLQGGLYVGSGPNTISVNVPVSTIDVSVTVDGQPLPSGNNTSSDTAYFYLRSSDTGVLHEVRRLWYTSSGGPWPNPAEDAQSIVPGTYDVVYRRGYSSSDNTVVTNPDNDKLPNGYRVLQQGLQVAPGSSTIAIDVKTARIEAVNVTLGGAALPTGSNPSSSQMNLYLRSKDTGALHTLRYLWYTTSGGPWPTTPAKAWSLVPGEYEVIYARDWSSSNDVVYDNVAGDKLPAGYRVLVPSLTLQPGSNTLNIDVPVATIDAVNVTLDGAPLPGGSSSNSSALAVYLRARDTGLLHQVRDLWYTSSGGPWPNPAEHAQSVPTGAYDVVVRRGWSTSSQIVAENDSGDKLPNGYRVLQENLVLAAGPNTINVNLPVAVLSSVEVLLDGAALPSGANPSSDAAAFYLRARDTGALHSVRELWYTSSGGPWPAEGTHTHSLLAGTYDLVYRRGWSSSSQVVAENPALDKLPNGYRVLKENVTLNAGANSLVIDLRQGYPQAGITLDGAPLPSGANTSSSTMYVFLRSRDTQTLHQLRRLWYTSSGGPWPDPAEQARSVPPGAYDLIYRRGFNSTDSVVAENPANDKLPNGFRVLQRCLTVQ